MAKDHIDQTFENCPIVKRKLENTFITKIFQRNKNQFWLCRIGNENENWKSIRQEGFQISAFRVIV